MGSPTTLDKATVLAALVRRVEDDLAALTRSQKSSQEGATHAETRAEDPKDMRSTEASYLARGLAQRVAGLEEALLRLKQMAAPPPMTEEPISVGSLVAVEDEEGVEKIHFLVPVAGGESLEVQGFRVYSLSPTSPLGVELMGRHSLDDFELDLPAGRVHHTISWVR